MLRDVVGRAEVVPGSLAEPISCLNDRVGLALRSSGAFRYQSPRAEIFDEPAANTAHLQM